MQIGDLVVAAVQVTEEGFSGAGTHVHAEPGDAGQVLDVDDAGLYTVRWERSGTACSCDAGELKPSESPALARPA